MPNIVVTADMVDRFLLAVMVKATLTIIEITIVIAQVVVVIAQVVVVLVQGEFFLQVVLAQVSDQVKVLADLSRLEGINR